MYIYRCKKCIYRLTCAVGFYECEIMFIYLYIAVYIYIYIIFCSMYIFYLYLNISYLQYVNVFIFIDLLIPKNLTLQQVHDTVFLQCKHIDPKGSDFECFLLS